MNPRQPYLQPYGAPPYPRGCPPPQVDHMRPARYEGQPGAYCGQVIPGVCPPQGPPGSYQPGPHMYMMQQQPISGYGYGPYARRPMVYADQHPGYGGPPAAQGEPVYIGYHEPQRPPPAAHAVATSRPAVKEAPPPVPPLEEQRKQSAGLRLNVPDRPPRWMSSIPPREFDLVSRGNLPSIVFCSDVTNPGGL